MNGSQPATTEVMWSFADPLATTGAAPSESAISTFREKVLQIVYVVISVIGFLGNVFVVLVLLSNRRVRKKVTNVYLINQGLLDALASLLVGVFALTASDGSGLSGYGDDLLCRLWLTRFPVWSLVMNSTFGLLALTIDRYFRIVRPIFYQNHFTKNKLVGMIVFTWLFGPLYNISWKWPTSGIRGGQCLAFAIWPNALTASVVGIATAAVQYFIPLVVLVVCYTRIILAIKGRMRVGQEASGRGRGHGEPSSGPGPGPGPGQGPGPAKQSTDNFSKAKANVIQTLVTVAVCFVLCWTWNEVFIFLYFVGYPTDFGSAFYHFTVVAVFSNSCINPFIYCSQYDDFKKSLVALFSRRSAAVHQEHSGTVVSDLRA